MRAYAHIQECEGTYTPNVTVKRLGPRQVQVLRLLVEAGRPRTASQLAGTRLAEPNRRALSKLQVRGLVSEHQGWAGRTFAITPEGVEWLELYW